VKLKQRIGDFRVRELLANDFVGERGDHLVYRVTKRKLTTPEAVDILAAEAGVDAADISIAGLKDRQAITIQHMSVPGGRVVHLRAKELLIEPLGRSRDALTSEASLGNAFEIVVRDLDRRAVQTLRRNLPTVREHGVVNYFDEQRFGNVKHGQGWIARDLMKGDVEKALKRLLTARSVQDDVRRKRFKERVHACWGDWRECRDEAGRFGQYHSVFEHLAKTDDDFAGAFGRVAGRIRLIHLYAWQSHLWNRAASELVRRVIPVGRRIVLDSVEGSLITFAGGPDELAAHPVLRLPGDGLEDVTDPLAREIFERELLREELRPAEFRIRGIAGFQLKGEDRPLLVVPNHLRVRPAEHDPLHDRAKLVRVRFELPRGSYATLVVKRLFGEPVGRAEAEAADEGRGSGGRGRRGGRRTQRSTGRVRDPRAGDSQRDGRKGKGSR
jgi:tRNA pseudouridine13 synthase